MTRRKPLTADERVQERANLDLIITGALADLVEAIPPLEPGHLCAYISAVNAALVQGAIQPNVGKILLYGAQLMLAAGSVERSHTAALPSGAPGVIER